MRILIAILLSSVIVTSCSKKMQPQVVIKDSIIIKEKLIKKDSIIHLPGVKILIRDTIPCPDIIIKKEDSIINKSGVKTSVKLNVEKGKISAECNTSDLELAISWLEGQVEYYKSNTKTVYVDVPGPKEIIPVTPKWVWYVLIYAIALTIYVFREPIIKLVKHLVTKW